MEWQMKKWGIQVTYDRKRVTILVKKRSYKIKIKNEHTYRAKWVNDFQFKVVN